MVDGKSTEERKTRSGRGRSSTGKRKRPEEGVSTSKKKMAVDEEGPLSEQLKEMKDFLGKKIDDGLKVGYNNVKLLSDRLNATQTDLNSHKAQTRADIQSLQANIGAISAKLDVVAVSTSSGGYASAARSLPTTAAPRN